MYRSLISLMPKAQPLLLDLYQNATVAYSLRKLRTAYTGNSIRVRRSSDNAEQDFGFVANDLDTASLLTFCGAGNGFVTTWYDQSTNGLNFTQITAGSQPRIVNGGVLNIVNSLPAIFGNGNFSMSIPSSTNLFNFLHNGSQSFITSVQKSDDLLGVKRLYGNLGGQSSRVGYQNFSNSLTINCTIGRGVSSNLTVNNNSSSILTTNQYLLSNEIDAGNATASLRSKMYLNGSTAIANNILTNAPSTANAFANFTIFDDGSNAQRFIGSFQELLIYPSNQSSNRNGIESNINSYYSIY